MSSPVPSAMLPTARLAVRTLTFAGILALLAPVQTHAAALTNPVEVTVGFASRPGFPNDTFTLVTVRSVLGAPLIGDVTIYAYGTRQKVETVVTGSQALVSVNLGRVTTGVMVCATFGGIADTGDENWESVQATNCDDFGPVPPRLEPPRSPPSARPPGLRSSLRMP